MEPFRLRSAVVREPLVEQAADLIRREILSGRLLAGARLYESALARQLDVSRGPIREAFRLLSEQGLVESTPHRGSYVAEFTVQQVIEVLTLRLLLEPVAANASLAGVGSALHSALEDRFASMSRAAEANDAEGFDELHVDFHNAFYQHSGHALLETMSLRLQNPMRLYVAVHRTRIGSLKAMAEQHIEMTRLAKRKDATGLRNAIRSHLALNLEKVMAGLTRSEVGEGMRLLKRLGPDVRYLLDAVGGNSRRGLPKAYVSSDNKGE